MINQMTLNKAEQTPKANWSNTPELSSLFVFLDLDIPNQYSLYTKVLKKTPVL